MCNVVVLCNDVIMRDSAKKSILNISLILPLHILQILINFVAKTVFIRSLGQDYLGINVLFGDITNLLSLTELGLGSAIMFALYKPLNTKDTRQISAIINYAKNLFNKIVIVIIIIGLLIIPSLKYVVNSKINMESIIFYYILYLITVAVTYFATYKTTLITADEKTYIVKVYYTITNVIRAVVQMFLLIKTKNFMLYLLMGILFNLLYNLMITIKVNKDYPFLSSKPRLNKKEKKELFINTKAVFKHKIATLILNSTDNILISSIISTAVVGKYSGYTTLCTTMIGLMGNFYSGIVHTVGKLNVNDNANEKHKVFNYVHIFIYLLAGISSVCFILLANDFINLWIGSEYILDDKILIAIVLNFYITIISYPVNIYNQTTKLFTKTQNIVILTAISNIVLSIFLGKTLGLFGILIATAIAKLITCFWTDPYILFKKYFECKNKDCILYFLKVFIEFIFVSLTVLLLSNPLSQIKAETWSALIIKGIISLISTSIIFATTTLVNDDYRKILVKIIRRKKNG